MKLAAIPLAVLAGLMSGGCATLDRPEANSALQTRWDMVSFEMKSWGEPLSSWRLMNDGGGSWTEAIRLEESGPGRYELVHHEIPADLKNFAAVERILQTLPSPAPTASNCKKYFPDLPYGTLRLEIGATAVEIAWNSSCQDEAYQPLIDALREINDLVSEWGRNGAILRSELVPASE